MRTSILLSVVSAALLAGTSIVSAQNEPKQEPKAAPNVQMNTGAGAGQAKDQSKDQSKPNAAQKSEPARKNETTGQGSQMQQGTQPQQGAQPRQAPGAQPSQGAQAPAGSGAAGASVNLTADQKTQIRQSVLQSRNAPKVANPSFSITVGSTVPRTVHLVAVPSTLVTINSAWRGHQYFIVGDQIIIVDRNMRIVAVLAV